MKNFVSMSALIALSAASGLTADEAHAAPVTPAPPYGLPKLSRDDFNRLAAQSGSPLFWRTDAETPGDLDPAELATIGTDLKLRAKFVTRPKAPDAAPAFTKAFEKEYRALVELRRREAVRLELEQGRPTLVETDTTAYSAEDKAVLARLVKAGELIDALYDYQYGATGLDKLIPKDDLASRAMFRRNHGPWCEGPKTEGDPFCNATPTFAKRVSQSYPADAVVDDAFCKALPNEPNGKDLIAPFTVVRRAKAGGFEAVPYNSPKAYGKPMKAIAKELRAAAKAITSGQEFRMKAYLEAAATAFETNDWVLADEAWAAMAGSKSSWYLRIGPDETYWDQCGLKSGFHMSFARLDPDAEKLKASLSEIRTDMETRIAALVGDEVYKPREVGFNLPDFIEIIMNAGDSRSPLGGTVGQSLPNFGKVAEESRGRTVVMANLYRDADSMAASELKDGLLFSAATLAMRDPSGDAGQMTTVLHEATHNLGPNGTWTVDGKKPEEAFGGDLDAVMEELKAETGALFLLPLLKEKGILTDTQVSAAYHAAMSWAFGQISQGLNTADGRPKTYSHVGAIQVNHLIKEGAITWDPADGAGTPDAGRFTIQFEKMPAAVESLMKQVVTIKAKADKAAADALDAGATSPEAAAGFQITAVQERIRRFPKATFFYGLR